MAEPLNLRAFLGMLKHTGQLLVVSQEVDPSLEMAALIHQLGERPVLFPRVKGSDYPVVAGICAQRSLLASSLGVSKEKLLFALADALRNPVPPSIIAAGPCQEVVEERVDLYQLPILTHLPSDGGPYVTAGVAIVKDPEYGRNMSFHRLMRLDATHFAVRLVEGRGTHAALLKSGGELEIAICIGNSLAVLLAAAMSPPSGVDELAIANALMPTPLVKCRTVDLEVPAEAEIVLEGRITQQQVEEGPFLDLTETMDIVRRQPVVEIYCLTHRQGAYYQALLPGGLEHKLLMGLPREPTIYDEVNRVCDCVNVLLTPGGGSWLHAVVQIRKRQPDDGLLAIQAAFRGHASLKHVLVVDDDINIYDPAELEWAIATRLQADRGVVILTDQGGSSLDPSALHISGKKSRTAKMGLDATIPWRKASGALRTEEELAAFRKVRYPSVPLEKYIG
ncbi:MAG: UbiD family decarboxylase [Anaerolineae bacterium]